MSVIIIAPFVPYFNRIKKLFNKRLKHHPFWRRKIIWILVRGERYGYIICSDLLYGWNIYNTSSSKPTTHHKSNTQKSKKKKYNINTKVDYCQICYVDPLWTIPTIKLTSCGHTFHLECIETILKMRWNGAKISFKFRGCPLCKIDMKHPKLDYLNKDIDILYDKLSEKMMNRLKYEKLDSHFDIINENGRYYNDKLQFAMNKFAYYLCFKCNEPYFVGMNQCLAAGDNPDDDMDKEHFICISCRDDKNFEQHKANCEIHGSEYIEWKCKFCCSISTFSCGSTHFCELCHRQPSQRWKSEKDGSLITKCPILPNRKTYNLEEIEIDECPLGIKHPQHGQEYCLGCGLCNAQRKQ